MRDPSPYAPHETLVAPGRAGAELWRLVVGLLVVAACFVMLGSLLNTVFKLVSPGLLAEIAGDPVTGTGAGNTPRSVLALLYSFGLLAISVALAARLCQNRSFASLIGPLPRAARQFWAVFRALIILGIALALLPPYDASEPLRRNLDFSTWALLLPFSLGAVLVQSASEEVVFRGYIQQQLAARFAHPAVWLLAPAALFGLGHYDPALAGENAAIIALWAAIFGLLTADLTARAGTLGPAIAMHMFNNVMAILLVSVPDTLSGLSLAVLPASMSDPGAFQSWLMLDFAMMIVSWLTARLALRV